MLISLFSWLALTMPVACGIPIAQHDGNAGNDINSIQKAHRATIETIRTFSCDIALETKVTSNASPKGDRTLTYKATYVRQGQMVRVNEFDGKQTTDVLLSDSIIKAVTRTPLKKNVGKSKAGDEVVTALKSLPPRAALTHSDPWDHGLLRLNIPGTADIVDFEELVARCTTAKGIERVAVDAKMCTLVTLSFDGAGASKPMPWSILVYFDPELNYLIRKVVYQTRPGSEIKIRNECQLVDVTQLEPGVFFPNHCKHLSFFDEKQVSSTAVEFLNVSVNQPLPSDAFDFRFPDGVTLVDSIRGTTYRVDAFGNAVGKEKQLTRSPPPQKGQGTQQSSLSNQAPKSETISEPRALWPNLIVIGIGVVLVGSLAWTLRRYQRRTAR